MNVILTTIVRRYALLVAVLLLASCAGTGTEPAATANTKSLLTSAGFRIRTPETAPQKELYSSLPAYKIERANVNGKVFYLYKDEKAGVAYVGHEPEYQRYKDLCQQQKMAESFYMSENMDSIQAHRWYGEWGAKVIYR
jgi:hypothetical protein